MRSLRDAIGVALQIAYEYPGWGPEHVSEMLDTYEASGENTPCCYDELMELALAADELKHQGLTYDEAESELLKRR